MLGAFKEVLSGTLAAERVDLMAVVYMNVNGSYGGGGPTVWAARMRDELVKSGHRVVFDNPAAAQVALCIIESGKVLGSVNRSQTRVIVRLDGAYYKEYWHSQTPDRQWRPDMTSLHSAIVRDVANVDCMVYQSEFSKRQIDAEIAERKQGFAIIHNGVDLELFRPTMRGATDYLKLGHIGMMRNGYLMNTLIAVHQLLKRQGIKSRLLLSGSMDLECKQIYEAGASDSDIVYCGQISNTALPSRYGELDIFLAPRMGSSCDNVVVEAQACGIPVVVPSWGGNIELVKDRQTGIIVQTGHWTYDQQYVEGMAEAVVEISKDLPGYKQRARQHAVQELSLTKMVDRYLEAMKQ